MIKNLKSELAITTRNHLEMVKETAGKEDSERKKYKIVNQHFYQLVNELLEQTSDFMKENNIIETSWCSDAVQEELEEFMRNAAEI